MNRHDLLKVALNSIARQTRPCTEVVVIDAGRDGSDVLCGNYPFVRYFRQTTKGLTAARNEALAHCVCDYVAMLDSDDYYEPEFLEECGALLDSGADIAYSQGYRVKGRAREPILINHRRPANVLKSLIQDNFVIASFAMQRRACLEAIGGYREELMLADDFDLYVRLALKGFRFEHVSRPLSNRRHHDGSLTLSNASDNVRAIKDIVEFHQVPLCKALDCTQPQLLATSEFRLARCSYESKQYGLAVRHIENALRGKPADPIVWAYYLVCATAPASVNVFEFLKKIKRGMMRLLGRAGVSEVRW